MIVLLKGGVMNIKKCCICGGEVTDKPGFICSLCEKDQAFVDQLVDLFFKDQSEEPTEMED
jgi:hypothetical protein